MCSYTGSLPKTTRPVKESRLFDWVVKYSLHLCFDWWRTSIYCHLCHNFWVSLLSSYSRWMIFLILFWQIGWLTYILWYVCIHYTYERTDIHIYVYIYILFRVFLSIFFKKKIIFLIFVRLNLKETWWLTFFVTLSYSCLSFQTLGS